MLDPQLEINHHLQISSTKHPSINVTFPQEATGQVRICYREPILSTILLANDMPNRNNRLVPIIYRTAILSTIIHVNEKHTPQQVKCLSGTEGIHLAKVNVEDSFPQVQTFKDPPSYIQGLLSFLPHVNRIPTSHNRPIGYTLQRNATEHSSTWTSKSLKVQQSLYLTLTEVR
jgi:hypothetical protein